MAYYNDKSLAYDLSLFEAAAPVQEPVRQPRKAPQKAPVVKLTKEQIYKSRLRKHNKPKLIAGLAAAGVIAFIIVTIIQGQVQLTELNQKISSAQAQYGEAQSVYAQMDMNLQARYSPSELESIATKQLGMTKATNAQKEFVSLSEGDKAEIIEKTDDNIFTSIVNAIAGLWS